MSEFNRIETQSVHAGVKPDPSTGAIMTPIFATSTYVQASLGEHKGFEYSRTANPTRAALEESFSILEGGSRGFALSSGCTATDILCHLLESGDHIISCDDVYGGTSRLFRTVWGRHGLETTFGDLINHSPDDFVKDSTRMIWVETPTNPMLKVIDIKKICKWAKAQPHKVLVVVDNTFATPYFQKPLDLGADVVLHSTTKYLNGHSDVIGGCLVVKDKELGEKIHQVQNSMGGVAGPFDAWLVQRGLKTLAIRMKRHQENAIAVAKYLEQHAKVERVLYPGLPSHPQHDMAKEQMLGFGGMVTFYLKGDLTQARGFLKNLSLFALAESLGGVESLVGHPAIMTHASIPAETRKELGITDSLIRLSVGIEHHEDLIADLEKALSHA